MSDTTHSPARRRVPLDRAELIEIAGADAIAFAHAQFSSDVAGLAAGAWQWSAWLAADGRARAVFALLRVADDRLLAWMPLGGAAAIADALRRYVLRAKVRLAVVEWVLHDAGASSGEGIRELDGGYAFALGDSRAAWLGPSRITGIDDRALTAWRLADIAAGLPWLASATQGEFLAPALDLARIGALRLDKGCFPGQEIAARLHFRGGLKQRLRRVTLRGDGDVPPALALRAGDARVGTVLYAARSGAPTWEALAVIDDACANTRLASAHAHDAELHSSSFP
jgi:folate-binding protein YgfZ